MLRRLKSKDKLNFQCFADKNDLSKYLFSDFIKQKKLAFISDSNEKINGLIFVEKKEKDFYLSIVTNNKKVSNNLLKIFFWNWKKDVYVKICKNNKIGYVLKSNGFRIINREDNALLLHYDSTYKRKR